MNTCRPTSRPKSDAGFYPGRADGRGDDHRHPRGRIDPEILLLCARKPSGRSRQHGGHDGCRHAGLRGPAERHPGDDGHDLQQHRAASRPEERLPSGTTSLAAILPNLQLPQNAMFTYSVSAIVATGGDTNSDTAYCISATGNANSGVPTATVLYSSSPATSAAKGWAGRLFNQLYVTGNTAAPAGSNTTAGGYCANNGNAQATQS